MFKNDDARGELNGFLDSGSHLVGDLRFDDTFRVDGRFEGQIHSSGRLVVGDSGEIEGEVHVAHIHVAGTIRGTVADAEKVEIAAGGKIYGELRTRSLIVADGAVLEGNCSMDESGQKIRSAPETTTTETPEKIAQVSR